MLAEDNGGFSPPEDPSDWLVELSKEALLRLAEDAGSE
jgi:hypothetical protein